MDLAVPHDFLVGTAPLVVGIVVVADLSSPRSGTASGSGPANRSRPRSPKPRSRRLAAGGREPSARRSGRVTVRGIRTNRTGSATRRRTGSPRSCPRTASGAARTSWAAPAPGTPAGAAARPEDLDRGQQRIVRQRLSARHRVAAVPRPGGRVAPARPAAWWCARPPCSGAGAVTGSSLARK